MVTSPAVLVTGSSTGIGAAIARRLDRLGYRVFAGVRRAEDGERLVSGASQRLRWVALDVTRADHVARAAETLGAECDGRLFGLVNNAGVAGGGPLEFLPIEELRRHLEVNVVGLLAVTQAMLPMLRLARGRIVNMGSVAGRSAAPLVGPYCASKHAVEALTDVLRLELAGSGVEVSLIQPGPVKTPIWAKGRARLERLEPGLPARARELYGDRLAFLGKLIALNERRGVPPERVADAVVRALRAKRPRTRYPVGADARVRLAMRRFLPDRWGDAILFAVLRRLERRLR